MKNIEPCFAHFPVDENEKKGGASKSWEKVTNRILHMKRSSIIFTRWKNEPGSAHLPGDENEKKGRDKQSWEKSIEPHFAHEMGCKLFQEVYFHAIHLSDKHIPKSVEREMENYRCVSFGGFKKGEDEKTNMLLTLNNDSNT